MIEQIPLTVDSSMQAAWWKPVVKRSSGWIYFATNVPGPTEGEHSVRVAKRSPAGTWSSGFLLDYRGNPAVFPDDIGHRQPTLALDGAGLIHVWAGMHSDPWLYWRSDTPGDVASLHPHHSDMPDQEHGYTYPVAATAPNGDVYLAVRQTATDGRRGQLYRWNGTAWAHENLFADAPGFSVYPDDLYVDAAGVHILWEWANGASDALRHCVSYGRWNGFHLYSADVSDFDTTADSPNGIFAVTDIEDGESLAGEGAAPGVQSAALAVTDSGIYVAYRRREVEAGPFRVRLAHYSDAAGGWLPEQTVYAGQYDTHPAVTITLDNGTPVVGYCKKLPNGTGRAHKARLEWVEEPILPGNDVQRLASAAGVGLYVAPTEQTAWVEQ